MRFHMGVDNNIFTHVALHNMENAGMHVKIDIH